MTLSINSITLAGNTVGDLMIHPIENGKRIASVQVVTEHRWTAPDGESKSRRDIHRVTILRDTIIDLLKQRLQRGASVYVTGMLQNRSYTAKDGETRTSVEVVVMLASHQFHVLDGERPSARQRSHADGIVT